MDSRQRSWRCAPLDIPHAGQFLKSWKERRFSSLLLRYRNGNLAGAYSASQGWQYGAWRDASASARARRALAAEMIVLPFQGQALCHSRPRRGRHPRHRARRGVRHGLDRPESPGTGVRGERDPTIGIAEKPCLTTGEVVTEGPRLEVLAVFSLPKDPILPDRVKEQRHCSQAS